MGDKQQKHAQKGKVSPQKNLFQPQKKKSVASTQLSDSDDDDDDYSEEDDDDMLVEDSSTGDEEDDFGSDDESEKVMEKTIKIKSAALLKAKPVSLKAKFSTAIVAQNL